MFAMSAAAGLVLVCFQRARLRRGEVKVQERARRAAQNLIHSQKQQPRSPVTQAELIRINATRDSILLSHVIKCDSRVLRLAPMAMSACAIIDSLLASSSMTVRIGYKSPLVLTYTPILLARLNVLTK
ncbi:hypothetical protein C8Q73DRAFT_425963 [Cubamyces lactineus]|nr:hypothetical protein C8Q73DRAFT_425963 [Cubamyces lactineus]